MDNPPKGIVRRLAKLEQEFYAFLRDAPWKQNQAGVRPKEAPAKEHDTAGGKPALLSEIDPPPANTPESQKPWYKTFEGWKSRFEVAAIFGGLFYAGITYTQWRDLRHNFEIDQRAWIGVKTINIKAVEAGNIAGFEVVITNTGKTPGHIDRGVTTLAMRPEREDIYTFGSSKLDSDTSTNTPLSQIMLFPQSETQTPAVSPHPLRTDEAVALALNKARFRISGTISYSDVFRKPHLTEYCFVWVPPMAQFNACKNHNEAD